MQSKPILGYVPYGTGRVAPFDILFDGKDVSRNDWTGVEALVIWGGEDIATGIYGEKASSYTHAQTDLSRRDAVEVRACKEAIDRGIPIIGICRGAQLVCALAGGALIQHVDGHGRTHNLVTDDGRTIETSSVHHQMMYPFHVEHKMIAWSDERRSRMYMRAGDILDNDMFSRVEPEIVWFPTIKALGIQGHPEFMASECKFVKYCMELVKKYIEPVMHQNRKDSADLFEAEEARAEGWASPEEVNAILSTKALMHQTVA